MGSEMCIRDRTLEVPATPGETRSDSRCCRYSENLKETFFILLFRQSVGSNYCDLFCVVEVSSPPARARDEVYDVSRPSLAVAGLSKLDLLKSVAVGHHVFGRRHRTRATAL